MRTWQLGASGPVVSAVGVGCSRLGGVFGATSSRRDEVRLVHEAVDHGITLFDTSDFYSHGQSELLLGSALASRRDHVVIATKGGFVVPGQRRLLGRIKPMVRPVARALRLRRPARAGGQGVAIPQDFSPTHLTAAVEGSLRRLRTDRIDLYQLHSPPASIVERSDLLDVLLRLRDEGKILYLGLAAEHAQDVGGFDRHPELTSLQLPLSVIEDDAALDVIPRATEAGLGILSRSCFAAGLLVGSLDREELQAKTPDWEHILAFRAVAEQIGRPRRELALQYNLGTPGVTSTIVGMRTPSHLREILGAACAPPLTDSERQMLAACGRSMR